MNKECITNYYKWADIAKGIAIILVILGHTYPQQSLLGKIIYSFHMPLFFLISGFLLDFDKYIDNFKLFFINNFKRLVFPIIMTQIMLFILLNTRIPYWFFIVLFGTKLTVWIILKLYKKIKLNLFLGLIPIALLAFASTYIKFHLFSSLQLIPVALLFVYTGYVLKKYNIFEKKEYLLPLTGFCIIFWALNVKSQAFNMHDMIYTNPFITLPNALCGSIIAVYFAIFLEKIKANPISNLLIYLGKNSMVIYLFHQFINSAIPILTFIARLIVSIFFVELFALNPYQAKSFKVVLKRNISK